jgi:MFS family permease
MITQAGSVVAGAVAAQPQATAIEPALKSVRSVLRATNLLVRSTSSPAVFAIIGFLAAAAASLLGVGIAQSNPALAAACGVTLVALLLAAVLRNPDPVVELAGGLGAFGLLVLSIAALARGATGWQVLGVGLGALAGLLLVGMLLPSKGWRLTIAAIGLLVLATVIGLGAWVWTGEHRFVPDRLDQVTCSVPTPTASASSNTATAPSTTVAPQATDTCADLYHAGVVTGTLIAGVAAVMLMVVIAFSVVRRRGPTS